MKDGVKETPHQVTLPHPFEITATEVTQAQFKEVMGYSTPSLPDCGLDGPASQISWHEAARFCNELSVREKLTPCYLCTGSGISSQCANASNYDLEKIYLCPGYRLPTEAEWEYAYRAGTQTASYQGAIVSCEGGDSVADLIGWYKGNSADVVHPVARKQPNAWGLHDMAGNVWEFCNDWFALDLGTAPATNPWGASTGSYRSLRGGAWSSPASLLRAAHRGGYSPTSKETFVGFRCARSKPAQ